MQIQRCTIDFRILLCRLYRIVAQIDKRVGLAKFLSNFLEQDAAIFKIRWEANFGLPAATIEDSELKSKFAGVFRAAWQMSESSADLDGNSLVGFFADAEAKRSELDSFIDIRPEVAAQAIGLIRANLADFGTYALVDVGASTLDVCVFNYLDGGDADKQALFVADVTLLGAQSPIGLIF